MGYHYKYKEYIYRHMYPKKSSALFTYHRHPDGRGGFLDDGICELCGTRGRTVLRLQNAKYISLEEAKRIVRNADALKQKKQAGLAAALGLLLLGEAES